MPRSEKDQGIESDKFREKIGEQKADVCVRYFWISDRSGRSRQRN